MKLLSSAGTAVALQGSTDKSRSVRSEWFDTILFETLVPDWTRINQTFKIHRTNSYRTNSDRPIPRHGCPWIPDKVYWHYLRRPWRINGALPMPMVTMVWSICLSGIGPLLPKNVRISLVHIDLVVFKSLHQMKIELLKIHRVIDHGGKDINQSHTS